MLKYRILPVTSFAQNCTLFWCDQTAKAALVDPGGEEEMLLDVLEQIGLDLDKILLTHGHLDHVGAAGLLSRRLKVPILGPHRDDEFLLRSLPTQCATFGFPPIEAFLPDEWLSNGDLVPLGKSQFEVRLCPGHTPGHVIFFSRDARLAQVGDVIFQGSIGRTDFPRGNYEDLIASIRNQLFPLGDDLRFIPGHGPMSTIGAERRSNPFVGDAALRRTWGNLGRL